MELSRFAEANALYREGRYKEAIRAYQQAIIDRPDFYVYYENIALALDKVGKFSDANRARRLARKLRPPQLVKRVGRPRDFLGQDRPDGTCMGADVLPPRQEGWEEDPAVKPLLNAQPANEEALKREYEAGPLSLTEDTFVVYRIIGNDLIPRHAKGQSRANVEFVLRNEPLLEKCQKLWIINRIFDEDERAAILNLLEWHRQEYIEIPFDRDEYKKIGWDFNSLPDAGCIARNGLDEHRNGLMEVALYRLKNLYVMNNNGARNVALREGRRRAKWVLPWDGNCFITEQAWSEIRECVVARPHLKYFVVPMQRVTNNSELLEDNFIPYPVEEPQLIFRSDAEEEFDERFPYGRRPKVELFWRLQIPGKWDRWTDEIWDQPRRRRSPEAQSFGIAGWVARMSSGMNELERQGDHQSFKNRGLLRQRAIIQAIDYVDRQVHSSGELGRPIFYKDGDLSAAVMAHTQRGNANLRKLASILVRNGEAALERGPYSVVDKTTVPPSKIAHDYWHPAPYWWPDPSKEDGMPYIRRDGERVPGTRLYEPESDQYDRTRLQRMFDDTLTLALAFKLTGRKEFGAHAALLVRTWFIENATRMSPHLKFAQVRMGHNDNLGAGTGIIEFKDLYYFLDAVRILEDEGALTATDSKELFAWLHEYIDWLESSPQGRKECSSANNHGTYYDLQVAAIFAYLQDTEKLQQVLLRAHSRIANQIDRLGVQPEEMKRSMTQHYVFFNLQGFFNIFRIGRAAGYPPLDFDRDPDCRLRAALRWIVGQDLERWPHQQIQNFDLTRLYPLILSASDIGMVCVEGLDVDGTLSEMDDMNPTLDPHCGVNPYWNMRAPGKH